MIYVFTQPFESFIAKLEFKGIRFTKVQSYV